MFESAFTESNNEVSFKQKTEFEGLDTRLPKEELTLIGDGAKR